MRVKKTVKKIIDAGMILMLPILAAEMQLGQESHEWMGLGMFCLFILHHVMNYRWWKGIVKGKYSPVRIFVTVLNFLLLLDFIALAYSGPKMSGFVLPGLSLPGSMQTARLLHLFASQWSFILMPLHTGVHSGLHGSVMQGNARFAKGILCAISGFGVYAFFDLKMPAYLFLQTHFVFWNDSKSLPFYFAEVICMMVFFGIVGHLVTRWLKNLR